MDFLDHLESEPSERIRAKAEEVATIKVTVRHNAISLALMNDRMADPTARRCS